jgi:polyhydroxyalkanoate synthase
MPSFRSLSSSFHPVSLLRRSGALTVLPDTVARMAGALHVARATLAREPAPVAPSPADVVTRIGAASLVRYRPHRDAPAAPRGAPILLCPSLINRLYVLDLKEGISVVEHLLRAGHVVYGIEWGEPGEAEHGVGFEGFTQRLASFLATACDDAHVEAMTVLGHCLGGTMAVALAATDSRHLTSLVLLTAPLSFHDGGLLSAWSRAPFLDPSDLTHLVGHVPAWITQPTFQILKPMGQLSKALRLWQSLGDPRFLEFFRCLETWINDNTAIPDAFFEDLIGELYQKDALAQGTLRFAAGPVVIEDVTVPVCAIAASDDHIVPPASALEPVQRFSSSVKETMVIDGGHIGIVVGGQGRKRLWPALLSWLQTHGGPSATDSSVAQAV